MKKIQVKLRYLFGNEEFYPVCDNARYFAQISGGKILTRECLKIIEKMGYIIQKIA